MKTHLYLILAAACFFLAGYTVRAQAAGPATNVVTLVWNAPINSPVPYVYEVQQSMLNTNSWTSLTVNLPSTSTNLTITIDKELKFFRVRALNATNSSWTSDFSNVASTLWPSGGGNLSIRLGP